MGETKKRNEPRKNKQAEKESEEQSVVAWLQKTGCFEEVVCARETRRTVEIEGHEERQKRWKLNDRRGILGVNRRDASRRTPRNTGNIPKAKALVACILDKTTHTIMASNLSTHPC